MKIAEERGLTRLRRGLTVFAGLLLLWWLLPVFDRGHVAIVADGDRFLGLITRIDLLNYLRRRVA